MEQDNNGCGCTVVGVFIEICKLLYIIITGDLFGMSLKTYIIVFVVEIIILLLICLSPEKENKNK